MLKTAKKLADGGSTMYKYQNKQIGISDFGMPLGMKLNPSNRWVKKAAMIPWDIIEDRYAVLFPSKTGNVAKPLRLALGALLIQDERRVSDEEITLQIQETPCLQYFCGLPEYRDEPPFDPSSMTHFRKRLTSEVLAEINELIITAAKDDDNNPPDSSNKGTLSVDATCAPHNIRYPNDLSLLNEARKNLERMIDELHSQQGGEKPRTYRKNAQRDYLNCAKKRQKSKKALRTAIGKQLRYIRRDLSIIDEMIIFGNKLSEQFEERLGTIRTLYAQQLEMWTNHTSRVDNRIVSIAQPWIRPIVRGKARAKCEFGAKLDISVAEGFVRLEYTSFDAYNEAENLIDIIERYRAREGHYPERVLVDQIYRNRDNLAYCKSHGIRLSGKPLGRPKRAPSEDRKQTYQDGVDRIEVERKFSQAKGCFGLGRIMTRLKETAKSSISLAIISLNIAHIGRVLCAFFGELCHDFVAVCVCVRFLWLFS